MLIVLYASSLLINIWVQIIGLDMAFFVSGWQNVLYGINESFYPFFSNLSTTMIAICIAKLNYIYTLTLEATNSSEALQRARLCIEEFRAIKAGISPLLFLLFSTKCVLLCNFSMELLLQPAWLTALFFTHTALELIYLAFIADETFNTYSCIPSKLRSESYASDQ